MSYQKWSQKLSMLRLLICQTYPSTCQTNVWFAYITQRQVALTSILAIIMTMTMSLILVTPLSPFKCSDHNRGVMNDMSRYDRCVAHRQKNHLKNNIKKSQQNVDGENLALNLSGIEKLRLERQTIMAHSSQQQVWPNQWLEVDKL